MISFSQTGFPRYMLQIGTRNEITHTCTEFTSKKITDDFELEALDKVNSQLHLFDIADKKTEYNDGRLYSLAFFVQFKL